MLLLPLLVPKVQATIGRQENEIKGILNKKKEICPFLQITCLYM